MGCGASKIRENRTKRWVDELTAVDGYFLDFEGWQEVIQGHGWWKRQTGSGEEILPANQEPDTQQKECMFTDSTKKIICGLVSSKVHAKVMLGMYRAIGAGLSKADETLVKKGSHQIAEIMNSLAAISLTYLHEDLDVDKFKHIRVRSFDALATALEAPFADVAKAAAAAAETAAESAAAGSSAANALASAADSVTEEIVAVLDESKAVINAHASSILAAAVIKGSQMGAGDGAAAAADVALQLFMTAQQKMSAEVDRLVKSSKPNIYRLVSIGAKLSELSAAASKKQAEINEDAEYKKLRTTVEEEVANFEAMLSKAVYSAVSKSVYGMAQLQVPKEGEAKNDDKDGSKDSKRCGPPKKLRDMRAKRKAEVEEGWIQEVLVGDRFKEYQAWEDQYGRNKKDGKVEAMKKDGSSTDAVGGGEPQEVQGAEGGGDVPGEVATKPVGLSEDSTEGEQNGSGGEPARSIAVTDAEDVVDEDLVKEEEAAAAQREADKKAKVEEFIKRVEKVDLAGKLSDASIKAVTEATCTALNVADSRLRDVQPRSLGRCVNCLAAIAFTYHFEAQSKRRCEALRGEAIVRLSRALVTALKALQILVDTSAPQPNPSKEELEELCAKVSSKIMSKVVESAKDAAMSLIPSSPLNDPRFSDSSKNVHQAKGSEAGRRLMDAAQDVLAAGIERGARKLEPMISQMFVLAWEARDVILSQPQAKSLAEEAKVPGFEEVCAKLEGKVDELRAAAVGWVDEIARGIVSKGLEIAKGQVTATSAVMDLAAS